jgi:hypothetical protein
MILEPQMRQIMGVISTTCAVAVAAGCVNQAQPPANPYVAEFIANARANANGQFPHRTQFKTAIAGTMTRIAFYQELNPDCSVRDIPTIRMPTQPAHGVVTIKETEDFGTYSAFEPLSVCNKNKARGVSVDYLTAPGYSGADSLTYEAILSTGLEQTTTVNLTVK